MITAFNLFNRKQITDRERRMLVSANKAAKSMFDNRFTIDLKDHWDKEVHLLTLEDVEKNVIEAIHTKYDLRG